MIPTKLLRRESSKIIPQQKVALKFAPHTRHDHHRFMDDECVKSYLGCTGFMLVVRRWLCVGTFWYTVYRPYLPYLCTLPEWTKSTIHPPLLFALTGL